MKRARAKSIVAVREGHISYLMLRYIKAQMEANRKRLLERTNANLPEA